MFKNKSKNRRREFLIDQNQTERRAPKKIRNRFLTLIWHTLKLKVLFRHLKASFVLIMALVSMTGFIVFAVFSPYFQIKEITIKRDNSHLDPQSIQAELDSFYGRNMLFITTEEIADHLKEPFPEFRQVRIIENWPDKLELQIIVSPPFINLYNDETANFSVISEDGVVLAQKTDESLRLVKIFGYEKIIQPRQKLTAGENLQKMVHAQTLIENLGLGVKDLHWLIKAREIHVILDVGTQIWLDLEGDIPAQIRKLELASGQIKLAQSQLNHIDLRVPDHLYWE